VHRNREVTLRRRFSERRGGSDSWGLVHSINNISINNQRQ